MPFCSAFAKARFQLVVVHEARGFLVGDELRGLADLHAP